MSNTPNLLLPEIASGSFQISPQFNGAMQIVDALLPLVVLDKDLAAPPTTVLADAGKRWIVGAAATGAWVGQTGKIALCTGADLWVFIDAPPYIRAYVIDETAEYRRGATAAWTIIP